jgi:type II secretory pathway component PulK
MKTLITALSLTALATTSVMAQTSKVKAIHRDAANIYQSDAQATRPSRTQIATSGESTSIPTSSEAG